MRNIATKIVGTKSSESKEVEVGGGAAEGGAVLVHADGNNLRPPSQSARKSSNPAILVQLAALIGQAVYVTEGLPS